MDTYKITCICGDELDLSRTAFKELTASNNWTVIWIIHTYMGACSCGSEYDLTVKEPIK